VDPITALAAATAIWSGIKATVDAGREVQDVFGQLGTWAEQAQHVYEGMGIGGRRPTDQPRRSETKEAFDIYAARVKMREMELEIRHMFLYGALNHLGMDGYKEFLDIRHQIKIQRMQEEREQERADEQFWEDVKYAVSIGMLALVLTGMLGWLWWAMR
jgi:hypothetical protein